MSRLTTRNDSDKFAVALNDILQKSGLDGMVIAGLPYDKPFASWAARNAIVDGLKQKYSSMLDVRVKGEGDDYLLWTAVDVRREYGNLTDPDSEHLAIAVLVLEGAVSNIVSANWDGLIEVAIDRLSPNGRVGVLQVIVDPQHVRDPPARATLIKFHGCAVLCAAEPAAYRRFLVATKSQITDWPNKVALAPLRAEVQRVATNLRAMMVGLSLQDSNLQDTFSKARTVLPWAWPCAPDAPWHVFCEDKIGDHQDDMLRVAYGESYGAHVDDIRRTALLRAYAKPALAALVMKIVFAKLDALMRRVAATRLSEAELDALATGLVTLRDAAAAAAPVAQKDMAPFMRGLIEVWSRGMALFRRGEISGSAPRPYEAISPLPMQQMLNDRNVGSSGLSQLGLALALLGRQHLNNGLILRKPTANDIEYGALEALGGWSAAKPAQVYFAHSAATVIQLIDQGALEGGNVVVLHSDNTWSKMVGASGVGRRSPRGASTPGTNRVRHVSILTLLEEGGDLIGLEQRFFKEVTF